MMYSGLPHRSCSDAQLQDSPPVLAWEQQLCAATWDEAGSSGLQQHAALARLNFITAIRMSLLLS